jgi:hypothetical protein
MQCSYWLVAWTMIHSLAAHAQMPLELLPVSTPAEPRAAFWFTMPVAKPLPVCSVPRSRSAIIATSSLDVPNTFSSCCLDAWPIMPVWPVLEWKIWKAARGQSG